MSLIFVRRSVRAVVKVELRVGDCILRVGSLYVVVGPLP